jgi:hypothetical protein
MAVVPHCGQRLLKHGDETLMAAGMMQQLLIMCAVEATANNGR